MENSAMQIWIANLDGRDFAFATYQAAKQSVLNTWAHCDTVDVRLEEDAAKASLRFYVHDSRQCYPTADLFDLVCVVKPVDLLDRDTHF
jgi:hypothetical protein